MKQNCDYVQVSLLQLIDNENALVSKINEINSALKQAKQFNLRSSEYEKQKAAVEQQLTEVRKKINAYFRDKICI